MLLFLLQPDGFSGIQMRFTDFILIILVPILVVLDIIALKIGLRITKAEYHTKIKHCAISFAVQLGVIIFIASPLLLLAFAGQFDEGGLDASLILVFIALALFIDIQVLNVIHKLGLKRAVIVSSSDM